MEKPVFLSAEWKKLVMANYAIDPVVLSPFVPAKTELDQWAGNHYISLVGFMFRGTRVKGIPVPFHTNFPEVNLRFYVRYKEGNDWKRGVVFISEIVPRPAISFVANTIFKENYKAVPMKYNWQHKVDNMEISYQWKLKKRWNTISVLADRTPAAMVAGSKEEFIAEHYWGYTLMDKDRSGEYRVEHPRWNIHPVKDYHIDCDFSAVYGEQFGSLSSQQPASVFLAEGSPVKVYAKKIL